MWGPIWSSRDEKFAIAMFVIGFFVGLPVLVGAIGYGIYRVVAAAVRGW
jgi:hypothetical protein